MIVEESASTFYLKIQIEKQGWCISLQWPHEGAMQEPEMRPALARLWSPRGRWTLRSTASSFVSHADHVLNLLFLRMTKIRPPPFSICSKSDKRCFVTPAHQELRINWSLRRGRIFVPQKRQWKVKWLTLYFSKAYRVFLQGGISSVLGHRGAWEMSGYRPHPNTFLSWESASVLWITEAQRVNL